MSEPEKTTETWTYGGERHASGGKITHLWIDANDVELWYTTKNAKASVVGGVYTLDVVRKDDGTSAFFGTLTYAGHRIDDEDRVVLLESMHMDTRRKEARLAAERKHARNPEIDAAVADLERLIAKCRTRQEAVAFRSLVSERLDAAWWKR